MSDPIVIVGAARTPLGAFQGELSDLTASELGGHAISAALESSGVKKTDVDEVLMGCVLLAGQGQAPARQAGFAAGLDINVPAVTLNKMCGSGMKTIMMAHDQLKAENGSVLLAGGMESMTKAPYMLPEMRDGVRLGHAKVVDLMFHDGLEDAYDKGRLMGSFADDCAQKYQFSREAQDEYALSSLDRALKAQESGAFDAEITPITLSTRKGDVMISKDEGPSRARPEKIPHLKPAFNKDGTVTAANASSISDGAAAVILMRESDAKAKGVNIRARILAHSTHAHEPAWYSTAPISAMQKLLEKLSISVLDVDLWEINEAFAVVPMAAMTEIGMDHSAVNVHGGACAIGHPIGATGARIVVTLLHALEHHNLTTGIASLCIGGGEATAIAIERV